MNATIENLESNVRSYCRSFPATFARAEGAHLYDAAGRSWLDLFAGAGALNYGHNEPHLRDALVGYLQSGAPTHTLDLTTEAKVAFLDTLDKVILAPRDLRYRVVFPGPTGTNAVEAALKLARKVTGRTNVVAFTNGFHGMTLGALALTGNGGKRAGAGVPLGHVTRVPFDGYLGDGVDTLDYLAAMLADPSSGVDAPAAFVVETIQAEGGVNVARRQWLQRLQRLARAAGALLIVDDIQVGCGRTGPFFSFEEAGLSPDIVCLSKSLSGYGIPLSVVLVKPQLDAFEPGEHNGTFRGHNLAFVTATAALERYWRDASLSRAVVARSAQARARLEALADAHGGEVRGRGLILGLDLREAGAGNAVSAEAFERGLIIETAGAHDEVVKLLPPLTITERELALGLDILDAAVAKARTRRPARAGHRKAVAAPATQEVRS
ncbi:MAG: diaminobutyrate--2-oxoglutarate transaminase [Deltaproteobacteria bacterium]|nr:diaminobutyrate--2-oxoglutarate transaminase [Deltaproteobacteria bacterium]